MKPDLLKIVILGDGGVGKSSLTLQYLYEDFESEYTPTKADSYCKELTLDGDQIKLEILDTAGQEEYSSTRDNYYRTGDGFILVFDLTDPVTIESLREIREQILRVKSDKSPNDIPIILVGNKCDLSDKRKVTEDQAIDQAMKWNCKYMETSAKMNINVDNVIIDIMRQIYSLKKIKLDHVPDTKGCCNIS